MGYVTAFTLTGPTVAVLGSASFGSIPKNIQGLMAFVGFSGCLGASPATL